MISVHTSPLEQAGSRDAGGMNVYITELAKALHRQGAEVEIFTRRTSSAQPEVIELDSGVWVRHVEAGPFEGLNKNDLPAQLCFFTAGILRTGAGKSPRFYDVVHSHYWLSGQAGWLAADRWHVPLVHTMHTMAQVKNAHLAHGAAPEPSMRIIGEEQVVAESDALIASTAEEASELVTLYGADPDATFVVPPGVALETFTPQMTRQQARVELGLPLRRPVVVFAGRLQPLKGPDVLIRAWARLVGEGKIYDPTRGDEVPLLVILGGPSGNPHALDELRALAWSKGVAEFVQFHPPVSHSQLAIWFRAADAVAMPSHSESFGLVALEAQAAGTPVIAAAVGGLRTAVANGRSGVLVPGHDAELWANEIHKFLADDALRRRLEQGALEQAQHFTWDTTAELTLQVYSIAGQRSRRRHTSGDDGLTIR